MSLRKSSLVQCSFVRRNDTKHIVIYYPEYDNEFRVRGMLVVVPVDTSIHPPTSLPSRSSRSYKDVELVLPFPENGRLNCHMGCICTVGNLGPTLYLFGGLVQENVSKEVHRYDLQKLSTTEKGSFQQCEDMVSGMYRPLLAQVGDNNIFVLGYGKTGSNASPNLSFHKYNIRKNEWACNGLFDLDKCETPDWWIRDNLSLLPHVVIGSKLHVSFGNNSFTYETENDTWYACKLFETFWSKQIKKKKKSGRPSLLDFYGKEVYIGAAQAVKKRKKEPTQFAGGLPFGFSGRGIIWDDNILMGIYYGDDCHVVAYLLDNVSERVVKSQPICFNTILGMYGATQPYGAHFVDLGLDGCFGLVHYLIDEDGDDIWECTYRMELLTFKVKRIAGDDDRFLEYELISNEVVIEDLPNGFDANFSSVFCV